MPRDQVVRAVEGDGWWSEPGNRRRRDRDAGRVEYDPGRADTRAVDSVGRVGVVAHPRDEVVRAVEGNARSPLATPCRDGEASRIEHDPGRAHTGSVDLLTAPSQAVIPDDEVVRPVKRDTRIVL